MSEFLSSQRATTVLHPSDPLNLVLDRLNAAPHAILPVVDAENHLQGVINPEEIHHAFVEPTLKALVGAEDLLRTDSQPLTPDDMLDHVLKLFVENDLLVLPVVNDLKQQRVVGIVRRHEISSDCLRRVQGPTSVD